MKRFDVVVPVYGRTDLLERALKSVHEQTFAPRDLIVVDDGSPGQEPSRRARRMGARVIELPANRGPSAARNAGIEATESPFVAFLDSDDRWAPEYLKRQREAIEGAPASVSAYWRYRDGEPLEGYCDAHPRKAISSATVVRREALEAVGGFDESLSWREEQDLLERMLVSPRDCGRVPGPHVFYRYRGKGSITQRRKEKEALQFLGQIQESA